jgi:hypothetical protein
MTVSLIRTKPVGTQWLQCSHTGEAAQSKNAVEKWHPIDLHIAAKSPPSPRAEQTATHFCTAE